MPSRGTIDGAPAAFADRQIQRLPVEEELARKPAALVRWRPGPGEYAQRNLGLAYLAPALSSNRPTFSGKRSR